MKKILHTKGKMTVVNKTFIRNRPLPSTKNSHFQNEAKSTTFLLKTSVFIIRMKNHFHIKGGALNLVLKWPRYCLFELVTSNRELQSID